MTNSKEKRMKETMEKPLKLIKEPT